MAVGGVILFHLGVPGISGGFVGVDIFFTISGFLIGSIVERQIRAGTFSLSTFYRRRVRRLAPALLFMLGGTVVMAFVYLPPVELMAFAASLIAALAFSSNLYFWRQPGYFAPAADTQPLLHTWSLGIEEQFYLLFPLAVLALHRWVPRHFRAIVLVATLLSLAASSHAVLNDGRSAFYLLPMRAWELLLGFLLALGMIGRPTTHTARRACSVGGLALILYAMVGFDPGMVFPGPAALVPCLGAVLVISACGSGDIVQRGLALPPMLLLGRISYPLYLWHWPLMVFQRQYGLLQQDASAAAGAVLVVMASLVMAVLSWRLLERPIASDIRWAAKPIVQVVGAAALFIGLIAAGATTTGYPGRFAPAEQHILSFLAYDPTAAYRDGRCMMSSGATAADFDSGHCLDRSKAGPSYLLMGDSHAAHLWWGLSRSSPDATILQATASGCRPVRQGRPDEWPECRKIIDMVFRDVLDHRSVEHVILAARWEKRDRERLGATLAWLRERGIAVVLIGPMVEYDVPVPLLLVRGGAMPDRLLARHRLERAKELDSELARTAALNGATYVSLFRIMCGQPHCMAMEAGNPLQFDTSHLTRTGSIRVARLLRLPALFATAASAGPVHQ